MANPNPQTAQLLPTQWQSGESGNPDGKPRGTKHLSTWIRELLEDETLESKLKNGQVIKTAPIKAIVGVLITKALAGDMKAFDMLGKYGYGTKLDLTSDSRELPTPILVGLSRSCTDCELRAETINQRSK
jgi:hypothetical protein